MWVESFSGSHICRGYLFYLFLSSTGCFYPESIPIQPVDKKGSRFPYTDGGSFNRTQHMGDFFTSSRVTHISTTPTTTTNLINSIKYGDKWFFKKRPLKSVWISIVCLIGLNRTNEWFVSDGNSIMLHLDQLLLIGGSFGRVFKSKSKALGPISKRP